ncbi:hypothetical protein ACFX2G_021708 [Malus domestica]
MTSNRVIVNLNARKDTVFLQNINERLTSSCLLVEGFLKEDDSTEVFEGTGSGEKQLTERARLFVSVFSTPMLERRLPIVPVDSSTARIPFPGVPM